MNRLVAREFSAGLNLNQKVTFPTLLTKMLVKILTICCTCYGAVTVLYPIRILTLRGSIHD
jgi:hypothetical protein